MPAQPQSSEGNRGMAEKRLSPGSYLVALLLNVQLHSAISSLRIKVSYFPLLGGSKHYKPSSWLCLTPNSACCMGCPLFPFPIHLCKSVSSSSLAVPQTVICEREFSGVKQLRV